LTSLNTYNSALWLCEVITAAAQNKQRSADMNALLVIGSMTYALLIYCKTRDSAIAAHKFASGCGVPAMAPIAAAFAKMDMRTVPVAQQRDVSELLNEFFVAFGEAFPGRTEYLIAVDLVIVLLRKGPKRWRAGLLEISARLLTPPRAQSQLPSAAQLLQLAELVVLFTHSPEQTVSASAINALSGVLRNIPEGTSMRFFDCLRVLQTELYPSKETDTFVGHSAEDEQSTLAVCCKKMLENVFKLGPDSPAVQALAPTCIDKMREMRKSQVVGVLEDTVARKARATAMATSRRPYDALKVHGMIGLEASTKTAATPADDPATTMTAGK
jgi:hypothetical protein